MGIKSKFVHLVKRISLPTPTSQSALIPLAAPVLPEKTSQRNRPVKNDTMMLVQLCSLSRASISLAAREVWDDGRCSFRFARWSVSSRPSCSDSTSSRRRHRMNSATKADKAARTTRIGQAMSVVGSRSRGDATYCHFALQACPPQSSRVPWGEKCVSTRLYAPKIARVTSYH